MAIDWNLVIGPCMAVFGEPVTYFAKTASFAITGVFDEAYIELTPLGAGEMEERYDLSLGSPSHITAEMPVLGVQLTQFPPTAQPMQTDTLQVRGATYVVREVRLDGHGAAKLMLNMVQTPLIPVVV
jgi:voltage-gated potassium channel Kch